MTAPPPILAMRRRLRVNGEPYLVAVVPDDLQLRQGDELVLRRIRNDNSSDEPTHALQVVRRPEPWQPSLAVRKQLAADDLTGSAVRIDERKR